MFYVQLFAFIDLIQIMLNRYLNKKKTAEEMEQQYQKSSSVDYSLKEGETLKLQIKNVGLHESCLNLLTCSNVSLSSSNRVFILFRATENWWHHKVQVL